MVARATQDSLDLGWSEEPLSDTAQGSEQPPVPLDNSDDDEPTRVATSAAAAVVPAARADSDVDASDAPDEGARLTEPGLAPPPPTSAEIAAAELAAAASQATARIAQPARAERPVVDRPRTALPSMNPPAVERGGPAVMAESAGAAPGQASPAAAVSQPPASLPPVSIPPPRIAPGFFTPASLAPTAVDGNEFASSSLLATMKRTRPTGAWTGVGLFIAALTFAGGIGIGRSMSPPTARPVATPMPPPLPATAAAAAPPSGSSTPPVATEAPAPALAPPEFPAAFDTKAARAALDDAAGAAKTCRAAGDPKGFIPTTVTFGPSGKVSNVAINSSRYAGTKTAKCVAERLSLASVPEFSGSPEALKKVVIVR